MLTGKTILFQHFFFNIPLSKISNHKVLDIYKLKHWSWK